MRDVVGLAAEHGLSIRNAMGTITVFDDGEGEHSFLPDEDVAITGVAAGSQSIVFWSGQVDSLLFCRREPDLAGDGIRLVWYLDSVWTYRPGRQRVSPEEFRSLYQQRTDLWKRAAQDLGAVHGRIVDERSVEEIWELADITDSSMVPGTWPAWLGWSTYFGPDLARALPAVPLREVGTSVSPTPNGGQIIDLLGDPAAVDARRYRRLHVLWLAGGRQAESD